MIHWFERKKQNYMSNRCDTRRKESKMNVPNNIFCNKSYLKEINRNFDYLIDLVHSNYTPVLLPSDQSWKIEEISLESLQEFNGSNQNRQIQFLSSIHNSHQLWTFLSLNLTSCHQTFLEELYLLTAKFLSVKQHLCKSQYLLL